MGEASWCLEDIPFHRIHLAQMRPRTDLLMLLAGTSFLEIASDTYAGNLAQHCGRDPKVVAWIVERWQGEELRHGRALRCYIERVWPEFPWQAAFDSFFSEYRHSCGVERYEATACLEMAARCVVETGTSTCYQAIRDIAEEPVLTQLVERIRCDEIQHYKRFLHYFQRYGQRERPSRWCVLRTLVRRLAETRSGDAEIALWHAFLHVHPGESRTGARYARTRYRTAQLLRQNFPAEQAMRMLMKPLDLPPGVSSCIRSLEGLVASMVRQRWMR